MPDVEITISNPGRDRIQLLKVNADGDLADALRNCILRVADQYADDPEVQRIAEAVQAAKDPR